MQQDANGKSMTNLFLASGKALKGNLVIFFLQKRRNFFLSLSETVEHYQLALQELISTLMCDQRRTKFCVESNFQYSMQVIYELILITIMHMLLGSQNFLKGFLIDRIDR